MRTFSGLALLSMALVCSLPAQESVQAPANAKIIFYRYKQYVGSTLRPSIYCDGKELTRLQNGRFFEMELPVGEHTCYAEDKQAGAVVQFEADKTYYFRADVQMGFWKGHFRLNMMMPEQGKYDVANLKPAESPVATAAPASKP